MPSICSTPWASVARFVDDARTGPLVWNRYLVNEISGCRRWPVADDADADRLQALGMFASALAGRPVAVDELQPGEPPWTDGQTIFIDPSAPFRANLEADRRAGVDDRRGQPGSRRRASAGPPFRVWPGAIWRSRVTARWSPTPTCCRACWRRSATPTSRTAATRPPTSLTVASGKDRDRRSAAGIRHHPCHQGDRCRRSVRPSRPSRKRRHTSRDANGPTGTRGTRRRRDRRHRRSRPVHQPGRRRRLHRQVAEEDAVVGAQDR